MNEIEEIREHINVYCGSTLEVTFRSDIEKLLKRVKELESDLKLNSFMLDKQTDLVRNAEISIRNIEKVACEYAKRVEELEAQKETIDFNWSRECKRREKAEISLAMLKEAVKKFENENDMDERWKRYVELFAILDGLK